MRTGEHPNAGLCSFMIWTTYNHQFTVATQYRCEGLSVLVYIPELCGGRIIRYCDRHTFSRTEKTDWSHLPSTGQPGFQSIAFGIESHALLSALADSDPLRFATVPREMAVGQKQKVLAMRPCACCATVRCEIAVGQTQPCTWNAAHRLLCDRPPQDTPHNRQRWTHQHLHCSVLLIGLIGLRGS